MFKTLKLSSALIMSMFCSATLVQADEQLLDGVRPFICDGEAIVFLEADNGWMISTSPTAEVKSTGNGWRFEDTLSGGVWYLREESRNSWVVDGVSEDGHFTADCIDLADSVSQVVTIIKPNLDENLIDQLTGTQAQLTDIQAQFADTNAELQKTKDELSKTQTLISQGEILAIQRVQRLCIWMKTYQHLDVMDRSFPFDGKRYKLCD